MYVERCDLNSFQTFMFISCQNTCEKCGKYNPFYSTSKFKILISRNKIIRKIIVSLHFIEFNNVRYQPYWYIVKFLVIACVQVQFLT